MSTGTAESTSAITTQTVLDRLMDAGITEARALGHVRRGAVLVNGTSSPTRPATRRRRPGSTSDSSGAPTTRPEGWQTVGCSGSSGAGRVLRGALPASRGLTPSAAWEDVRLGLRGLQLFGEQERADSQVDGAWSAIAPGWPGLRRCPAHVPVDIGPTQHGITRGETIPTSRTTW